MNDRIQSLVGDLESISEDTQAIFGELSVVQLNWTPTAESWSVAQCYDHLIRINRLYFPLFEKMEAGPVSNTFWEKYSPFSGFFGRYLIKVLSPDYSKKVKTSKQAYPSASEIDGGIIEHFRDHQRQFIEHIGKLSPELNLEKTVLTSPLIGFVTYSLNDCLTMLVVHERRHFEQAKRVMDTQSFPPSNRLGLSYPSCETPHRPIRFKLAGSPPQQFVSKYRRRVEGVFFVLLISPLTTCCTRAASGCRMLQNCRTHLKIWPWLYV